MMTEQPGGVVLYQPCRGVDDVQTAHQVQCSKTIKYHCAILIAGHIGQTQCVTEENEWINIAAELDSSVGFRAEKAELFRGLPWSTA